MKCPLCKAAVDRAIAIGDDRAAPKKGDYSVCLACSQLLMYDGADELRMPTLDEVMKLQENAGVWQMIGTIQTGIMVRNMLTAALL